jgi:hypothetical protein
MGGQRFAIRMDRLVLADRRGWYTQKPVELAVKFHRLLRHLF